MTFPRRSRERTRTSRTASNDRSSYPGRDLDRDMLEPTSPNDLSEPCCIVAIGLVGATLQFDVCMSGIHADDRQTLFVKLIPRPDGQWAGLHPNASARSGACFFSQEAIASSQRPSLTPPVPAWIVPRIPPVAFPRLPSLTPPVPAWVAPRIPPVAFPPPPVLTPPVPAWVAPRIPPVAFPRPPVLTPLVPAWVVPRMPPVFPGVCAWATTVEQLTTAAARVRINRSRIRLSLAMMN